MYIQNVLCLKKRKLTTTIEDKMYRELKASYMSIFFVLID